MKSQDGKYARIGRDKKIVPSAKILYFVNVHYEN